MSATPAATPTATSLAAPAPLVEACAASVRFGGATVLENVDMVVSPGEIVTIVGPNGSGKSSLLRLVIGALSPSSGSVRRAPGLRIGYVPQRLMLDRTLPMTVTRFLALPSRPVAARVRSALEEAGVPGIAGHQLIDLSGGQLQRVLLARALLGEPTLLVLDEPTQGLDQNGSADFYTRLERLRDARGCAVLMVSHELHVVMSASDRVVCLNGHVCCQGTPESVSSAPAYRALFGSGTQGALALYRHEHDHSHDGTQDASHEPPLADDDAARTAG